ncbi:unnamed protein product, partial [Pocillopora meandrina]
KVICSNFIVCPQVLFHFKTLNEPATIQRLCSVLHKSTGEILQKKPRCLTKNSNAEVVLHTYKPVCVELYKDYKDLGRFMLRYSGETIAVDFIKRSFTSKYLPTITLQKTGKSQCSRKWTGWTHTA